MDPHNTKFEVGYDSLDSSLEAGNAVEAPVVAGVNNRGRFSIFRLNRTALIVTAGTLSIFFLIGLVSYVATSFLAHGKTTDGQNSSLPSANYAVGSSLPVSGLSPSGQLLSGEADHLTVNGQLSVNDSLVLLPTIAPKAPTAGQIYYDQTTNVPYYYNGSQFISLNPTAIPQHITSLGGASGTIALGSNLSISGNRLSIVGLQSGGTAGVSSLQGTANQVDVSAGTGSVVVSLPQDIDASANVQFGSLKLTGGNVTLPSSASLIADNITTVNPGDSLSLSGSNNITFSNQGGANTFIFPTSGGPGQVICTTAITCASGGGQAVLLEPTGSQTASANKTSVFINKTGGTGNLIELQDGGVDQLVIDNAGNTTITKLTISNGLTVTAGTVTIGSLNTPGILHTNGSGQLSTSSVLLGTDTTGNYLASLGSVTGLAQGGTNGVAGGVPTLSVIYGSAASTAVQGNTTLTCPSGTGNLSGGGNSITLGAGGSCNNISITNSPTFTGTLTVQGAGGIVAGSTTNVGLLTLLDGTSDGFTTTLQTAVQANNVALTIPADTHTTDTVCLLTLANCAGAGGGVTGSGTNGTIAVFTSTGSTIGDSLLSQSGGTVTANGNFNLTVGNQYKVNGSQISSANLSNDSNLAKLNANQTFTGGNDFNTNSTTAINVEQNGVHNNVLTVDTASGLVGIDQLPVAGIALDITGATNSTNFTVKSGFNSSAYFKNYLVSNGNTVHVNDVVVLVNDSGTSDIEDTTTSHDIRVMGVAASTVTGNGSATDSVAIAGNSQVTADAVPVAIGDQLVTSTTAGEVTVDNNATTGILGYATSSKGAVTGLVGVYIRPVGGVNNPVVPGNFTVQGASGVNLGSTSNVGEINFLDGTNDGFTTTIKTAVQANNVALTIPADTHTTDTVCLLTLANCAGAGGGVTGSGTNGTIAVFTSTGSTIGDSLLTESGSTVTVGGNLTVTSTDTFKTDAVSTVNNGDNLTVDASGNITFSNQNGANSFVFPTSGGTGQTICTSGITCASGGGSAVILEPSAVQTASANKTAVFINKNAGTGNLIDLQTAGNDDFVISSGGDTTLGNTANNLTLQGNGSTSLAVTAGGTTTTVNFAIGSGPTAPNGAVTYQFENDNTVAAGTYTICTTVGNCAGAGGGVTGSGATGTIPVFTGSGSSIGNSPLTVSGSDVTATGNLAIQGSGGLTLGTLSHDGKIVFNNASNSNTLTLVTGASGSNFTLTLPTTKGNNGDCLESDGTGVLSFQSCTGGAGGGVTTLDSQTGVLTLDNSSGGAGHVTINDASTAQKGIAQFNSTDFTTTLGVVDTKQGIAPTSSPTFAGITLNGATDINTNSTTALNVERNGVHNNVLTVDTTNAQVGINQTPTSGVALAVNGITQTSNLLLSVGTNTNSVQKNYTAGTGGVHANDVIVLANDSSNSRVLDTTTSHDTRVMGVALTAATSGNISDVAILGNAQVTADSGAVNIGDQLVASTTSGEVTVDNNATTGILGYATSSKLVGSSGLVGVYIRPVGGVNNPVVPGNFTVQGASGVTVGSTSNVGIVNFLDGTSDGFTTSIQTAVQANNVALTIPADTNTTDQFCLKTLANCFGAGGGVTGSGTAGKLAEFTGSGSSIGNSPITDTSGNLSISGTTTLSALNASGILHTNGSGQLSTSSVLLGTDTTGNYLASLGSVTGLAQGGTNGVAGGVPTLSVIYGSAASTAVQGNTTLTCPSGTGNLSGGGNSITLGAGGSCNNISITNSPTFTGTLTVQGAGGIVAGSTTNVGLLTLLDGTSDGFTTTLQTAVQANNVALTIPADTHTTDTVCLLTLANCAGAGGGVTGSGTNGTIAVFTSTGSTIGDSLLSQSGGTVTANGNFNLTVGNQYKVNGSQISSANLSNDSNLAKLNANQTFTGGNDFEDASNSATAFQVQNSNGYNELNVDTSGNVTTLGNVTATAGHGVNGALAFADGTNDNDSALLELSGALGGSATVFQLPNNSNTTQAICTSIGNCLGGGGGGANTALSNLVSVAINTALNFQATSAANIGFSAAASGAANSLTVTGQTAGGSNNNGGAVTLQGGTAVGTGTGGLTTIGGGAASSTAGSAGGAVAISGANGATTGAGGAGGGITLQAGAAGGSGNINGSAISITAGATSSGSFTGNGGGVTIQGGTANGGSSDTGGNVTIQGGLDNSVGGGGGGNINLTPGTSANGNGGSVFIATNEQFKMDGAGFNDNLFANSQNTFTGPSTGSAEAAVAIFNQPWNNAVNVPADTVQINTTNTTNTQTNGLLFNRNGAGGTTTNGINITNTAGTLTNGLAFSGTIGTDIFRNSGTLTLQGGGGVSITSPNVAGASGAITIQSGNSSASTAGNVTIDTGGMAAGLSTVNIGNTNAKAVQIGNNTSNPSINIDSGTGTIAIGNGAEARTLDIGTGGAAQTVLLGSTSSTSTTTIQGASGSSAIALTAAATAGTTISATQPASSGVNGTNAGTTLTVTGASGGNTSSVANASAGSGGAITLTTGSGGTTTGGSGTETAGAGGTLTLQGGNGGGATSGFGGAGANVVLQGGNGGTSTGANSNANGGNITIAGGAAGTGGVGGTSGSVTIQGAAAGTTNIETGASTGGVHILDGTGTGTVGIGNSAAGAITIQSGSTIGLTAGAAQQITLTASQPASSASNGTSASTSLTVTGATGGNTSGITAQTAGTGGSITLQAGTGGATTGISGTELAGHGGTFSIRAGNGGNATSGIGGIGANLNLSSGSGGTSTGTNSNPNGGNINISAGGAGSGGSGAAGTNGVVIVQNQADSTGAFQVQNGSNAVILGVDTKNGRVGINESAGNENLDVSGTTKVGGTNSLGVFSVTDSGSNTVFGVDTVDNDVSIMPTTAATSGVQTQNSLGLVLQGAYWNGSVSTNENFTIQNQSSTSSPFGSLVIENNGNTPVVSINGNGGATFENSANATTAFQVQNASGNNVLTVDTSSNSAHGQVILGNVTSTAGHGNNGVLAFADGTNDNDSALLELSGSLSGTATVFQLPVSSNTTQAICTSVGNCGSVGPKSVTKIVAMGSTSCSTPASVASADPGAADFVASGCAAQTAINLAIGALPAQGGVVYLEEGTYIINASINLPSNVTLEGAGQSTIIELENSINANFQAITNTASTTNVGIENLQLLGNAANNTSGSQYGVYNNSFNIGSGTGSSAVPGLTLNNVTISNFRTGAVYMNQGLNSVISDSTFVNDDSVGTAGQGAIQLFGSNDTITGNLIEGGGNYGIITSATNTTMTGNTIEGNGSYGIFSNGSGNTISGNTIMSNADGVELNANGAVVSGNSISSNTSIGVLLNGISDGLVTGNSVMSNGNYGIDFNGGSRNTISGNIVSGNSSDGIEVQSANNNVISGNKLNANTTAGIDLEDIISETANNVTGNDIVQSSGNAIKIAAGVTNTYLSNNTFSGGATLSDAGTLTVYADQESSTTGNLLTTASGSATAGTAGSNVTLQGGAGATVTTGSAGGAVTLQGGAANGSGNNAGGGVTLTGGTGANTGSGGQVSLQGGAAAAVAGSAGGAVSITAANGSATGAGGNGGSVSITAGNGGAGSGNLNGGNITLTAGSSTNTGTAGTVSILGGTGTSSDGTINIGQTTATNTINIGNANTATGKTQTINIGAGTGAGTGDAAVTLGSLTNASTTSIQGGTGGISVQTGPNATGGTGTINLQSGNATTTGTSGNVSIASGYSLASGNSGAVFIESGAAFGGTAGSVTLDTGTSTSTSNTNVYNGSFEVGSLNYPLDGFTAWVNSPTLTNITTQHHAGSNSLQISNPASPFNWGVQLPIGSGPAVTPGTTYSFTAWVKAGTSPETVTESAVWYNTTYVTNLTPITDNASGWTEITGSGVAPVGATSVYLKISGTGSNGDIVYLDDVTINANPPTEPSVNVGSSNASSVVVGNANESGVTSLLGGSGGIDISSSSSVTVLPFVNSANAFQIQNASTANLLNVNTTNNIVTLATAAAGGELINDGSTLNTAKNLGNLSSGSIGTAAATVDIYTSFVIPQTTGSVSVTVPNPTDTTAGRVIYIANTSVTSTSITVAGITLNAGNNMTLFWNGSAWSSTAVSTGVTIVGTFSGSSQVNGASISGNTITFGPADITNPGMVSTGVQQFAGAKAFETTTNSTTGFQIQNSSGASGVLFNADTTNSGAFTFEGVAPASVSSGNGTAASTILTVTGPAGGAITGGSGTQTSGAGAAISLTTGAGGADSGSAGTATAGAGGAFTLQGGNGGNASSGKGGAGANISLTSGNGGTSSGSNNNSNGGAITLTSGNAGTGGSGTVGNGGAVTIDAGTSTLPATQIADKTFETTTENMTDDQNATVAIAAPSHSGTKSLQITASGTGGWQVADAQQFVISTLIPGHTYQFSAWAKAATTPEALTFDAWFSTNGFAGGGPAGLVNWGTLTDTTGGFTQVTGTLAAPAGDTYVGLEIDAGTSTNGEVHNIDDMTVTDITAGGSALNLGATNAQAINIGNANQTEGTTIQGGYGGVNLISGASGEITLQVTGQQSAGTSEVMTPNGQDIITIIPQTTGPVQQGGVFTVQGPSQDVLLSANSSDDNVELGSASTGGITTLQGGELDLLATNTAGHSGDIDIGSDDSHASTSSGINIGGFANSTEPIKLGISTGSQTISIGAGVPGAGKTEAIKIGTALSTSTGVTSIAIGATTTSTHGATTVTILAGNNSGTTAGARAGTDTDSTGIKVSLGDMTSTNAVCSSLGTGATPASGTAYELVDCSGTPAADYAEQYPTDGTSNYGDIMMLGTKSVQEYDTDGNGNILYNAPKRTVTQLVKADQSYATNVIGVVSDNYGDFTSTGGGIIDPSDSPMPIALNGRVPVNISPSSAPITVGDYIAVSNSDPGKGMKATQPGEVIGKALEAWDPISGQTQIMVFVEQGYYPGPTGAQLIQDGGDASLASLSVSGDTTLNNLGVTGDTNLASLNVSGSSTLSNLTVTDSASITNLTVQTATVSGNLTVMGLTTLTDLQVNGHIITGGSTPVASLLADAGSSNASVQINGNDTAGTITITVGAASGTGVTGPTAGDLVNMVFNKAYGKSPNIVLSPNDHDSAALLAYPSAKTATGFNLAISNQPTAQTTYSFTYLVVQ